MVVGTTRPRGQTSKSRAFLWGPGRRKSLFYFVARQEPGILVRLPAKMLVLAVKRGFFLLDRPPPRADKGNDSSSMQSSFSLNGFGSLI